MDRCEECGQEPEFDERKTDLFDEEEYDRYECPCGYTTVHVFETDKDRNAGEGEK